jgi:hypothetical protein
VKDEGGGADFSEEGRDIDVGARAEELGRNLRCRRLLAQLVPPFELLRASLRKEP